ncbi:hypothetical protein [Clostridium algoriphilum]|nr:hypothetical protein [Clostridium algoriphilum]
MKNLFKRYILEIKIGMTCEAPVIPKREKILSFLLKKIKFKN